MARASARALAHPLRAHAVRHRFCYTGGDDCLARLWHTNKGPEQEPVPITEAIEALTTIASGTVGPILR
jgi:hypothetical protein